VSIRSRDDSTRGGDRELVREALDRAPGAGEPELAHLLEAVPALMAEARRRRSLAGRPQRGSALGTDAQRAIPKLAVATAVVVALAATAALLPARTAPGRLAASSLDALVLHGTPSESGDPADILLETFWEGADTDG
jgi:hypothetical protein